MLLACNTPAPAERQGPGPARQVVLDRAVLAVRARDARPAARALPVEHGHCGRAGCAALCRAVTRCCAVLLMPHYQWDMDIVGVPGAARCAVTCCCAVLLMLHRHWNMDVVGVPGALRRGMMCSAVHAAVCCAMLHVARSCRVNHVAHPHSCCNTPPPLKLPTTPPRRGGGG